jgi:hypothetical protein
MRKKLCWVFLATLVLATPASAQKQIETAFEFGIGYGSPAISSSGGGGFGGGGGIHDMATLLIQGDDYLFETGIGLDFGGNTVFGWMVRGAARPFLVGNVLIHTGGEFSLHSNSIASAGSTAGSTKIGTMTTLGFLIGVSHQITDRINGSVNVYPLSFTFGGFDTITSIGAARLGAHFLF